MAHYFNEEEKEESEDMEMAEDQVYINADLFRILAHLMPKGSNDSKSSIRNEFLATLQENSEVQIRNNTRTGVDEGFGCRVAACILDQTSAHGCLYSAPSVKSITSQTGEEKKFISEKHDTVEDVCKTVACILLEELRAADTFKMVTYCISDQAEHVMTIKGIERMKNRSDTDAKKVSLSETVKEEMGMTLAEAYGDRYYRRGATKRSERVTLEDGTVLRSAEELLDDLEASVPGPFFELMNDRTVGRAAITRRVVLYMASNQFFGDGQVVIFWGGSHCLKPSDFGIRPPEEEEDEGRYTASLVESMAVMIYKPNKANRGMDWAERDEQMARSYFSNRAIDQIRLTEDMPDFMGTSKNYNRIVLINRLYVSHGYGEADHGAARILTQLPRCPFWIGHEEEEDISDGVAVQVSASDTDVLLYVAALRASASKDSLPKNIYMDISRPMRNDNGRFIDMDIFAEAVQHLVPEDTPSDIAILSVLSYLILMGCSDYCDGFVGIGPKKLLSNLRRFSTKFMPLVERKSYASLTGVEDDDAIHYMLDVERAYSAIVYAMVAAKKNAPKPTAKRGLTKRKTIATMTEDDLLERSRLDLLHAVAH